MLKYMLSLLLCFTSLWVYAQEIRGRVVDSENKPLQGVATILLDSTSKMKMGAVTDANGSFSLKKVAPGSYVLKIVWAKCSEKKIAIEMKEESIELKTISLTATKKEKKSKN